MMRLHLCQCLPVDNLRIKFKILEETFNPYKEFELWEKVNKNSANSFFIGRVRPFDQFGNDLKKLEIVHYKGMTENYIKRYLMKISENRMIYVFFSCTG